ncbi:hypothetical protein D4R52_02205 [bacterium]|nr:MAG: hypothetical protein D4R52_02205 [bacterium]
MNEFDEVPEKKGMSDRMKKIIWAIVILGVILAAYLIVRDNYRAASSKGSYQTVFLDNGQVYFGKLHSMSKDMYSLTDIYYLRAGSVQPTAAESGSAPSAGSVDLVKLGSEIHAPRDEMIINKSHVLFYEDVGEGSEVMKLIRAYQQGK